MTKYKHGISQVNYQYRPNGLRSSKTEGANTTGYIWGGDKLVLTANGNDQVMQKFTYGNALISMEEIDASSGTNSGRRYYMHNAHGDVVNLTDETGAILSSYDYDAFGNEKSPNICDSNPFRYCGEYWDSDTGTYYLRARNYDPSIGRFQSEDTHWNPGNMIYGDREYGEGEKKAADILAINQRNNLYAYCMGNPLGYRDENGEFVIIAGVSISAAALFASVSLLTTALLVVFDPNIRKVIKQAYDNIKIAKSKGKIAPPSGLIDKKTGRIKTPDTHPGEFQKNKDGSYTHRKTGWKSEKAKGGGQHGGPHWDVSPARGNGHINVGPEGNVF